MARKHGNKGENLTRFATYLTAIEMGKSQKEAAYAAKHIREFQPQGQDKLNDGRPVRLLQRFGTGRENIIRIAKTNPAVLDSRDSMAMAFMEAMLNSMCYDDEDGITNRYEDR